MKKLLVAALMAMSLVTVGAGEANALPTGCSMAPYYASYPDDAIGWCASNWAPGDRAQLRLTCRNSTGQLSSGGLIANVIWNANQVSTDKCPKDYPIIYTWVMARWNIA